MEADLIIQKVSPHVFKRAYPDIENFRWRTRSFAHRRRWNRRQELKHKADVLQIGRDIVQNNLVVDGLDTLHLMAAIVAVNVVYQEEHSAEGKHVALLRKYELLMIIKDNDDVKITYVEGCVVFRVHIFCARVPLQVARRQGLISSDVS